MQSDLMYMYMAEYTLNDMGKLFICHNIKGLTINACLSLIKNGKTTQGYSIFVSVFGPSVRKRCSPPPDVPRKRPGRGRESDQLIIKAVGYDGLFTIRLLNG